jgi:7-keto-8-aminopelargonate synthetase-like enzyme
MTDAELDAFAIDESHGLLMMGPAGTALLPTLEFKAAA